jgi:hypothetical protein
MGRGFWEKVMTKKARPLSSVVLDKDYSEMLVKDISVFEDSALWY